MTLFSEFEALPGGVTRPRAARENGTAAGVALGVCLGLVAAGCGVGAGDDNAAPLSTEPAAEGRSMERPVSATPSGSGAPAPPAAAAMTPARLFPLHLGDRWRERIRDAASASSTSTATTHGVTAMTPAGLAVVYGPAAGRPSFYRSSEAEVALVTPAGDVLEPVMRAPVREGASWSYTVGEHTPCAAEITSVDETARVGDLRLTGCVSVERVCRSAPDHRGRAPGAAPQIRRELYCPDVGRVRLALTLGAPSTGAPEAASAAPSPRIELVAFRVQGAPALAPRPGCDGALLLPSDVDAACGPGWSFHSADEGDACVFRMTRGDESLTLRALVRPFGPGMNPTDESALAPLEDDSTSGLRRRRMVYGARVASATASRAGCPDEGLDRLMALTRSL